HGRQRDEGKEADQHAGLDRGRSDSSHPAPQARTGTGDRVHQRRRARRGDAGQHPSQKEDSRRQHAAQDQGVTEPMGSRRSMVLPVIALAAMAALASACVDDPVTPTSTAPFSSTDLLVGTGPDALTGSTVTVNYTGWLYDASKTDGKGLQFDSSIGRTPFQFTLGTNQVIQGWDRGIPGMKIGGRRRLVIPPSLAYGSMRSGPIPPNSTLVFDIDLISIP